MGECVSATLGEIPLHLWAVRKVFTASGYHSCFYDPTRDESADRQTSALHLCEHNNEYEPNNEPSSTGHPLQKSNSVNVKRKKIEGALEFWGSRLVWFHLSWSFTPNFYQTPTLSFPFNKDKRLKKHSGSCLSFLNSCHRLTLILWETWHQASFSLASVAGVTFSSSVWLSSLLGVPGKPPTEGTQSQSDARTTSAVPPSDVKEQRFSSELMSDLLTPSPRLSPATRRRKLPSDACTGELVLSVSTRSLWLEVRVET